MGSEADAAAVASVDALFTAAADEGWPDAVDAIFPIVAIVVVLSVVGVG